MDQPEDSPTMSQDELADDMAIHLRVVRVSFYNAILSLLFDNVWFLKFYFFYCLSFALLTVNFAFIFLFPRWMRNKPKIKTCPSKGSMKEACCEPVLKASQSFEAEPDFCLFRQQDTTILNPNEALLSGKAVRQNSLTHEEFDVSLSRRLSTASSARLRNLATCTKCDNIIIPVSENRRISSSDKRYDWHESCFRCQGCDKNLVRAGYYMRNNFVYCETCMDETFGDMCERCDDIIKLYSKDQKEISSLDGTKHWHDTCYVCLSCEKSLLGKGYYTIGNVGGIYCAECYDKQEADICHKCHTRIYRCSQNERQIRSKDKAKSWHAACYVCNGCDKSLVSQKHYVYEDGNYYCPKCYDDLTSQICSKCNERILRCSENQRQISSKEYSHMHWHDTCYICYSCNNSLVGKGHYWWNDANMYCAVCYDELTAETCFSCDEPIKRHSEKQKQIVSKDHTKYWHDLCYTCTTCKKSLVGCRHFSLDEHGPMYCAECFDEITGVECAHCEKLIKRYSCNERQITHQDRHAGLKYYHDYCYQCSNCKGSLSGNNVRGRRSLIDGNIYCDDCFDNMTAYTCSRCEDRIFRFSRLEKQISSKDNQRHWHDFCFVCSKCRISLVNQPSFSRGRSLFCTKCLKTSQSGQAEPTLAEFEEVKIELKAEN